MIEKRAYYKLSFLFLAMPEIHNIIFDLGNVILNLDYSLTVKEFRKLGYHDFDIWFLKPEEKELLEKFEVGAISPDEFRKKIKKYFNSKISDLKIDSAWNAMLLNIPIERINFLKKLKKKYRLFLLSNTNEIHIHNYSNYLKNTFKVDNLLDIFEKEYYSHVIKMRKPNKEIFQYVLNDNNLRSANTLFVDDSVENILGAEQIGIQTHLLKKDETILSIRL